MEYKQISKGFGKFLFGGVIWTVLSVFLAWLFIDYLGMYASVASVIISSGKLRIGAVTSETVTF